MRLSDLEMLVLYWLLYLPFRFLTFWNGASKNGVLEWISATSTFIKPSNHRDYTLDLKIVDNIRMNKEKNCRQRLMFR